MWAFTGALLLIIYFIWDTIMYKKEDWVNLSADSREQRPIQITGKINFLFLIGVVLSVAFINADMLVRKSSYPTDLKTAEDIKDLPEMVCRGGSCIIDPFGHYMMEPVWDEETVIYADLDMTLPISCKMEHDAVGHYARPDVLELIVHE